MAETSSGGAAPQSGVFVFRGNATAAGGFLTKLDNKPVPLDLTRTTVHGQSSLPLTGGVSLVQIAQPDLAFPDFIRYENCVTSAVGVAQDGVAQTTVSASVNNVMVTTRPSPEDNAPGISSISFAAERLFIKTQSTHRRQGNSAQFGIPDREPPQTTGMQLIRRHADGKTEEIPLRIEFDNHLLSLPTLGDVEREFKGNRDFFHSFVSRLRGVEGLIFGKSAIPRTEHGNIICSIVRRIFRGDQPIEGNVLREPGFGSIFFGELVIDSYSRRISLVRMKMGSDPDGEVDLSVVCTNGVWG